MCCGEAHDLNRANSVSGFLQFAFAIYVVSISSHLNKSGKCAFDVGADGGADEALCSTIPTLGWITIFSALILSVTQGCISMLFCNGVMLVEVLGRAVLALAWLATAIMATVFGAMADHTGLDPQPSSHTNWRHPAILMCWLLFGACLAMFVTALVRTCRFGCGYGHRLHSLDACVYSLAECLCVAWLLRWLCCWTKPPSGRVEGHWAYAPLPGGAGGPGGAPFATAPETPGLPPPGPRSQQQQQQQQAPSQAAPVPTAQPVAPPGARPGQQQYPAFGPPPTSSPFPAHTPPAYYPTILPNFYAPFSGAPAPPAMGFPVVPPLDQASAPLMQAPPHAGGSDLYVPPPTITASVGGGRRLDFDKGAGAGAGPSAPPLPPGGPPAAPSAPPHMQQAPEYK